ncbi:MAG TPA: hypothetical protein VFT64_02910 [Rickettsiales bacterium]|nr:hypothetical protein [Rickettsiales bacterium]
MRREAFYIAFILLLTGCQQATSMRLNAQKPEQYKVVFKEPDSTTQPAEVLEYMTEESRRVCPNGFDKKADDTDVEDTFGGLNVIHTWKIECL